MAVKVNVKVPSRVTTNVKAESTKTSGNITVGRQGPPGVGFVGIPGEDDYWGLGKSIRPTTSGDKNLGTSAYPFADVYSDDGYINDNLYVGGNLSVTGNLDVSGNFTLGNESTDSITTKGDLIVGDDAFFSDNVNVTGDLTTRHIYPEATETYNLGSATKKWDNVYARTGHFNESTLVLGTAGAKISVVNSRVQLEGTSAGEGAQFIGDTHIDGGTLFAQNPNGPQFKILNTNATNRYDFELDDNGHLNISGLLDAGAIKFDNDLLPSLNGGNLGTSSSTWDSIHATTGVLTKASINTNQDSSTLNVGGNVGIYGDLDIYDGNNTSNKIVSIYDSGDEGKIDIKNAGSTTISLGSNSNSYFLNGNLGLGTSTPSVKLEISATDAIKIPVGTTAQRPTASDGMLRYNSEKSLFEGYQDSSWQGLGGVIDADQDSYISTEKTTDDDTLYFYTSGLERAVVTNGGDFNVANNLTVSGDLNVSGNFNLGDSTTDKITTQGDLHVLDDTFFGDDVTVTGDLKTRGVYPTQSGAYDIGSESLKYNNIYAKTGNFDGNTINLGVGGARITLSEGGEISTVSEAGVTIPAGNLKNDPSISGNLYVESGVYVTGSAYIKEDLVVTGNASAASPTQNGHLTTKLYVDSADSSLSSDINTVSGLIVSNDSDISALNAATGSLQSQVSSNDSDISALNAATGSLQSQVTSNDSDISTLTSNLTTTGTNLQNQITSNDNDISALNTATGSLQTQVTSNDNDIAALNTATGNLQNQVTSNDSEISALNTATGSLQGQVTSNDSDISTLTSNLSTTGQSLLSQITSNDSDLTALNTATGSLQTQVNNLSGDAVFITGDQNISGIKQFQNNVTIGGDLTVNGTTFTVDTSNVLVEDPVLYLAKNQTGTPTVDAGFVAERGDSVNVGFIWDESEEHFATVKTTEIADDNDISIQSYADLKAANTIVSNLTSSDGLFSWTRNSASAAAQITNSSTGKLLTLSSSAGELFTFANDGNLGIGSASPAYKLEVNGSAKINNYLGIGTNPSSEKSLSIDRATGWTTGDSIGLNITNTQKSTTASKNKYGIKISNGGTEWSGSGSNTYGAHITNTTSNTNSSYGAYISVGGGSSGNIGIQVVGDSKNSFQGSVGIGTTAPSFKLDVAGTSNVTGRSTFGSQVAIYDTSSSPSYSDSTGARLRVGRNAQENISFFVSDLDNTITAYQDADSNLDHSFSLNRILSGSGKSDFHIKKDGTSQLTINKDGNIGLGHNTPTERLQIRSVWQSGSGSGSNLASLSLETYNSNSSSYGSYFKCKNFVGSGGGPNWRIGGIEGYWTTNKVASIDFITGDDWLSPGNKDEGEIAFTVYNNSTGNAGDSTAIEAMRIHQSGNIGINTTSPSAKLHVRSGSSTQSFLTGADELLVEGSDHAGISIIAPAAKRAQLYFNSDAFLRWVDNDGVFSIDTSASASKIAIGSSGANVGIGTTAPDAKLQIMNNDSSSYRFGYGGTSDVYLDADDIYFRSDNGAANHITKKGGSLGIGTTTPSVKLDISSTDAIKIPVGTTAQRPTAAAGMLRLNTTTSQFEGYKDGNWQGLGGVIDVDQDTYVTTETTSDDDTLFFYTSGIERARINNDGSTHIKGDLTVSGSLNVSGNFNLGDSTTDSITTQGDLFVKDDASFADEVHISGALTVDGTASAATPTQNSHLATKLYVDNADSSLQSQITSNDTDITALNTATGSLQTQVTSNDTDISALNTATGSLQTQVTANDSDITALNTATGVLDSTTVKLTGNQTIAGVKTFSNNAIFNGDLTVNGTTMTVDTSNVLVEDPVLLLAKNQTGSASLDAGFIAERGDDTNVGFIWDESDDHFAVINTTEDATDADITIASYANFKANLGVFSSNVTSLGSVGIGTNNPSYNLDIYNSTHAQLSIDGDTTSQLLFGGSTGNRFIYRESDGDLDLTLGGSNIVTFEDGGSVGIGTTTPSNTLDINGGLEVNGESYIRSTSNVGLRIQTTDQGITNSDGLRLGLNGTHAFLWVYEDKPLALATNGTERATILGNGNFGIGTTSPDSNLDIEGTGSPELRVTDTTYTVGAYIQSNDAKTIFGSRTNHPVQIDQNAGAALYIDTSKNVGIGTTSPESYTNYKAVTISDSTGGQIYFKSTTSSVTAYAGADSNGAYFAAKTNHPLRLRTNNTDKLFIATDGNVGIGTTSANARLKVITSSTDVAIFQSTHATTTNFYISNSNATANNTANLYFGPANGVNGALIQAIAIEDFSVSANRTADLAFQTRKDGTFAEHMRITAGGNVSIGSSHTPQYPLDVKKPTNNNDDTIINARANWANTGNDKKIGSIQFTAYDIDVNSGADYIAGKIGARASNTWTATSDVNGDLVFETVNSATLEEQVRIAHDGNVGIGTTTPETTLHVAGDIKSKGDGKRILLESDDYLVAALTRQGTSGSAADQGGLEIYNAGTTKVALFANTTSYINNGANFGIGTISPSTKLHVVGSGTDDGVKVQSGTNVYLELDSTDATTTREVATKYKNFSTGTNFWWTGLNQSGAYDIAYGTTFTNVNTKLRVQTDGNVGIGTVSASAPLHVNGDARIGNPHANEDQTSRLIISNSISGSSTYDFLTLADTSNNGSETGRIVFKSRYDTTSFSAGQEASFISSIRNSTSGAYHLAFGTTNDSNADAVERVRIASTGKVGIGTTAPALPLHVSDADFGQLRLTRDATDDRHWDFLVATNGYLAIKPNNTINTSNEYVTIRDSSNNEKIRLATADDSFFVGGSVGIGTSTPSALLHVDGTLTVASTANFGGSYTNFGGGYGSTGVSITSAGNIQANGTLTVDGTSTFYGSLDLQDNDKILLGAGNDLEIFHDGSNSWITNNGTGILIIGDANGDVRIRGKSGEESIVANDDGAVELYHDNSKKLETTSAGVSVTGDLIGSGAVKLTTNTTPSTAGGEAFLYKHASNGTVLSGYNASIETGSAGSRSVALSISAASNAVFSGDVSLNVDNKKIKLGASDDLQIYHNGSDSIIADSGTGGIKIDSNYTAIRSANGSETAAKFLENGAVELYYDNSKKLETTSGGVTITGLLTATTKSFTIDHPTKPGKKLRYGSLEGPENGVYIRGKSNNNSIELPEYWTKLVDEDSITVQLTAIGKPQQLYVERIDNNVVYVQSEENRKNISQLNYYYLIHAERIDVDKLEVEIEE